MQKIYKISTIVYSMTTTIQISDNTKQMLEEIKKQNSLTYDEVIQELLSKKRSIPDSLFNTMKGKWTKKDRMLFEDE